MTIRPDEITVMEHGGTNPRRVPVTGVSCSWALNEPGSLSCFARYADLRAAGLGDDLDGMWLSWRGRAGEWGGVIDGNPVSGGTPEIAASGWAELLRGRALPPLLRRDQGRVGGLAALAVTGSDAETEAGSLIALGTIDDGGEAVTIDAGTQDVLEDFLPALVEAGGLEWIVDFDRRFHAGRFIGRDRSHVVRLTEGRHFASDDCTLANSAWSKSPAELLALESNTERVAGVSTGPSQTPVFGRRRRARRKVRRRKGGRGRWRPGRRQTGFALDPIAVTPGSAAATDAGEAQPAGVGLHAPWVPQAVGAPLETTPVEVSIRDIDGAWAECQPGNVVRLLVGSAGFSGWLRILNRGYESASGVLLLSGEALSDRRAAL